MTTSQLQHQADTEKGFQVREQVRQITRKGSQVRLCQPAEAVQGLSRSLLRNHDWQHTRAVVAGDNQLATAGWFYSVLSLPCTPSFAAVTFFLHIKLLPSPPTSAIFLKLLRVLSFTIKSFALTFSHPPGLTLLSGRVWKPGVSPNFSCSSH